MSRKISEEKKQEIRRLRNEGLSLQNIADQMQSSFSYVFAVNTINPETGRQFESAGEYRDYAERQRGYKNFIHYVRISGLLRGRGSYEGKSSKLQQKLEDSIELMHLEKIVKIPSNETVLDSIIKNESSENLRHYLNSALEKLPKKWRKVLYMRFYEGKTLREVGEIIGETKKITREAVRQTEGRALRLMRYILEYPEEADKEVEKTNNLIEAKKVEDGELLLVYFLSKSEYSNNESSDFVNEYYHGGKVRTKNSINLMKSRFRNKKRLENLKKKYFSREII